MIRGRPRASRSTGAVTRTGRAVTLPCPIWFATAAGTLVRARSTVGETGCRASARPRPSPPTRTSTITATIRTTTAAARPTIHRGAPGRGAGRRSLFPTAATRTDGDRSTAAAEPPRWFSRSRRRRVDRDSDIITPSPVLVSGRARCTRRPHAPRQPGQPLVWGCRRRPRAALGGLDLRLEIVQDIPPFLLAQPVLEGGHRRTREAVGDPALQIRIGMLGNVDNQIRRRWVERGRQRAVSPSVRPVAHRAVLLVDRRTAGDRGRGRRMIQRRDLRRRLGRGPLDIAYGHRPAKSPEKDSTPGDGEGAARVKRAHLPRPDQRKQ